MNAEGPTSRPGRAREWRTGEFIFSTDPARIDIDAVHRYLATESYWARNIPLEIVKRSIENSLCFGVYDENAGGRQIGFARVITDFATYGYIGDVFIIPEYRGRGLSKRLVEIILAHPDLQGFRRWALATHDAQSLYAQFGFKPVEHPERHMEIRHPAPYGERR